MSKRLDIFISVCVAVVLGTSGFYSGIYYGFMKSEEYVEILLDDFEKISEDVDAFKKVSDPKTIRLYVKELNKILDDITFLGKMVESGQTSAESLDGFFSEYQDKIDNVNGRIKRLYSELTELEYKFKEQVTRLTGETDDNLESIQEIQDSIQEQIDYVNKLNVDVGQSINNLEDDVQTIKSSKYGKKIWTVKK